MTPHPFDFELQLNRHGHALRQLAVELLRDAHAADDAVQEVWLRAVRHPPRHETSVGGWLATMVKNVASGLRRGERRRAAREVAVVLARAGEVEDHAAVLAREELAHRLVAAVSALEAPLREAIWRRYFEGMAPRQIAAVSGVPVATVKSRLQRGLQQLREKLGDEGESGWRSALAVAFGMKQSGAVGVAATTWSGVLLMTAWTKVMAAVAVVAVAAALFWYPRDPGVAPPSASVARVDGASVVATGGEARLAVSDEAAVESGVERSEVKPLATAQPTKNATLRGRCVDENGAPMAGCRVTLHGWGANEERMDAWLRDHAAKPEWADAVHTTAADGVFSFEFWPPPPFQVSLRIEKDEFAAMNGRWSKVEEATILDVGDVPMSRGVRVAGRVVDEVGNAIGKARVSMGKETVRGRGTIRPVVDHQTSTGADGRFSITGWCVTGTHSVRVQEREVVKPTSLDLSLARPLEDITVVVKALVDAPTISGRVVDDADQPVRGALVMYGVRQSTCYSDRDGLFTLQQGDPPVAGPMLVATCEGYEPARTDAQVPWGTANVVLRLQRGNLVTIRVTDPADVPIANYTVRLIARDRAGSSSADSRVRARGPFENGTATVSGIARGKWLVVVEFPSDVQFLRRFETIEVVAAPGPNFIALRAESAAHRPLRVAFGDGAPASGTRVQLCELFGGTFADRSIVFAEEAWLRNPQNSTSALVLFEGVTDGEGRLLLAGPGQRGLGLRVLGPGHVPVQLPVARLDDERELLVMVGQGARLVGKIVPVEMVDELRRKALGDSESASSSFAPTRRPSVRLLGADGTTVPDGARSFEERGRSRFEVGDDGSFDITGLPPGSWRVQVRYVEMQNWGRGSVGTTKHCTGTEVTLTEGVTTRLDLDLQSILPGTLEGEVTLNGAPLGNALVTLQPTYGPLPDGRPDTDWINLETDAEGRFTHRGRAGVYTLSVQRMRDRKGLPMLRALTSSTVVRGQTTRQAFPVLSGTLQLKVLDATGKPVPYLEILAPDDQRLPRTGPDGTTTAELTAQNSPLRVLPRRLQSAEAQQKLWAEGAGAGQTDPLAPHWLTIGTAAIAAGQTTTLELRLPPEWEK